MKTIIRTLLAAPLLAACALAGPVEVALIAATSLVDQPSYGWATNVDDDARSYEIEGRTDKSGYSLVTMPILSAVRERLIAKGGNATTMQAVYKGDEECVIQTPGGWKKPAEIFKPQEGGFWGSNDPARRNISRAPDVGAATSPNRNASRGGGGGGLGAPQRGQRQSDISQPAGLGDEDEQNGFGRPYSNLQFTLCRPHDELAIIVANYTDIKEVSEEEVSGVLSETGAKLLLVHVGQKRLTPLRASGNFRLWLKDGAIVKYELVLDGLLAVKRGGERREIAVSQKSLTQIRDVGAAEVAVPDEARKRLGG